ncbi:MAG TPA: hypothetical protein VK509_09450, partial [Polyangiales bacterium]|nr:hypothetical protein [Polyangiales bacterium]
MSSLLRRALQNRRTVIRGLIAAGAVVFVGGGALLLWLPRLATARITEQLRERTGLEATVQGVSLGLLSISVDEVVLGDGAGPRMTARDVRL